MNRPAFWSELLRLLEAGRSALLAIVAENTDHSPGAIGARMLVADDGTVAGTIGGGIMEHTIINEARQILAGDNFTPEIVTLEHFSGGSGLKSGLSCAGSQTNLYTLCRPEVDLPVIRQLAALVNDDRPGELTISAQGMEAAEGPRRLDAPSSTLVSGGADWTYTEQLLNHHRIAIIGGGHCSLALSGVMHQLDYRVAVFEVRSAVGTLLSNRSAHTVQVIEDYSLAGALIAYPELTSVVVLTTDIASDVAGLLGVLPVDPPFIGVMGSQAKIAVIMKRLKEQAVANLDRPNLHAPVGLPINSHTPGEIAISIAGQILAERKDSTYPRDPQAATLAEPKVTA